MGGRTDLEQLVYQMSTDIRALERQNTRALKNVDTTANKIEARYKKIGKADMGKFLDQTFDRSRLAAFEVGAARVPIFGQALEALGPAGLVAAAGIGATALAIAGAVQAMQFADEIDDTSARLNVGAEALQEYRYALTAVGGEAKDADSAIEGFQKKLGEGLAGGRAVKWFERLGFSQEDLRVFPNTEAALDAVLDRIANLGTEAERAAVGDKLGLGPMVALAREGSARLAELRREARDLGIVMDADLVKRAADANQQFEVMSRVIDVQLKSALVDIGPVLVSLMGLVAGLARGLNGLADSWRAVENRSTEGLRSQALRLAERREFISDLAGDRPNPLQQREIDRLTEQRNNILEELRARSGRAPQGNMPTGELIDVSGGGGGSKKAASGPSAEDIAKRRGELERALAIEIARLSNNEQLVQLLEREDAIARRTEQYEALKLSATEARSRALADQVRIDDARRSGQLEEIRSLQQQTDIEYERLLGNERFAQSIQDRVDLEREIEQLVAKGFDAVDATRIAESNLLDIQRARAEVTARIVADAALERRLTLAQLAGDEDRVRQLGRALEIGRRARQIERDRNLNYGEGAGQAANDVDEEIAAASRRGFRDGVRGLLDDLQDGGLEGVLSSIFGRVTDRLKDNLADLLTDYLAQSFGGFTGAGASAGGNGWAGQVANAALSLFGRREGGGPGRAGVPIVVGEKRPEVFVPSVNGTILPSLSALGRGGGVQAGSRTSIDFRQTIDLRGANGDAQIRDIAYRAAAEGAQAAYQQARADIPAEAALRRKYSR